MELQGNRLLISRHLATTLPCALPVSCASILVLASAGQESAVLPVIDEQPLGGHSSSDIFDVA